MSDEYKCFYPVAHRWLPVHLHFPLSGESQAPIENAGWPTRALLDGVLKEPNWNTESPMHDDCRVGRERQSLLNSRQ